MDRPQLGLQLKLQAVENQSLAGAALIGRERYSRYDFSARLEAGWQGEAWAGQLHYLAFSAYQDLPLPPDPQTARRPLDLSSPIHRGSRAASGQRIDRAWLSWSNGKLLFKAGRGALTWGNGVYFQVLDLFNPFSFDTKDWANKPGIDMLFAQHQLGSQGRLQWLLVPRTEPDRRRLASEVSSAALRYEGRLGALGYQLLLAQDYRDEILGFGLSVPVRGLTWKSDLQINRSLEGDTVVSVVSNLQYVWYRAPRTHLGILEYYRNGFAQGAGRSLTELSGSLYARLARSQIFTTGRDYLALGLNTQFNARLGSNLALLGQLGDGSGLAIAGLALNAAGPRRWFFGLQLPWGRRGSEFGGRALGPEGARHAPTIGQVYARHEYVF